MSQSAIWVALVALTWVKAARSPLLAFDPSRVNTAIFSQFDLCTMTAVYNIQAPVFGGHIVHRRKDSQMLDVLDVGIGVGIDVRRKAT